MIKIFCIYKKLLNQFNFIFGVSSLEENLFFVVNFVILTLILKFLNL
jgi:hypothetical protein